MAGAEQQAKGAWRNQALAPAGLSVKAGTVPARTSREAAATLSSPAKTALRVKQYYVAGEHYDWIADTRRFEKVFHTLRSRESLRVISRHSAGGTLADIGCGTGLLTRRLSGSEVIALDINRWNLQRTLAHSPTVHAMQGDAERLPLRSDSFDLVVCTETLEHLAGPRQALAEMLRTLKPGGKLVGSVPSRSWVWKTRRYLLSTCPASEPFHNQFNISEASALLSLPHSTILELFRGVLGLTIFFVLQKDLP